MHTSAPSVQVLLQQASSLLLYQAVLGKEVGQAFLEVLHALRQAEQHGTTDHLNSLHAYGRWFHALAAGGQSWREYLLTQLLQDENPFTRQAQSADLEELPRSLLIAARHDLAILQTLANCSEQHVSQWVQERCQLPATLPFWEHEIRETKLELLSAALESSGNWSEGLEYLTAHYRKLGVGIFAEYRALRWQAGHLVGIAHPDPIQVGNLAGYEAQRDALLKNTEFLLKGYPALHVLLYGSRGSGKSSLVKGLLQEYGDRNLRLIEVAKSDLQALPMIVEQVRQAPQKFVIFVDDLSFEEDDDAFKALKVVLEGTLTARPQNVVVYATSNRRHLIREFFADRPRPSEGDEVHAWDTVQEKLSFSDRFGLTLTFEPANQTTYLAIVHHLADQAGISLASDELEHRALQWATRHNGRSGRTARQFIDFLQAELAVNL